MVVFSGFEAGLIGLDHLMALIWSLGVFGGGLYLIYLLSRGQFGLGDVKLGFTLGLLLANWQLSLMAVLLAGWIGLIIAGLSAAITRPQVDNWRQALKLKTPFGPALMLATLILFVGQDWLIANLFNY